MSEAGEAQPSRGPKGPTPSERESATRRPIGHAGEPRSGRVKREFAGDSQERPGPPGRFSFQAAGDSLASVFQDYRSISTQSGKWSDPTVSASIHADVTRSASEADTKQ